MRYGCPEMFIPLGPFLTPTLSKKIHNFNLNSNGSCRLAYIFDMLIHLDEMILLKPDGPRVCIHTDVGFASFAKNDPLKFGFSKRPRVKKKKNPTK